jgi:hypothetical protein
MRYAHEFFCSGVRFYNETEIFLHDLWFCRQGL